MPTKKEITDALLYQKTELEAEIKTLTEEIVRISTIIQQHRKQLHFIHITLEDNNE